MTSLTAPLVTDLVIATAREQVDLLVEEAGSLDVTDDETRDYAADLLQRVKGHAVRLEQHRKSITDPLRAEMTRVNEKFKPLTDDLGDAERQLKGLILPYELEQRALLEQERADIEAAASRAAMEGRQTDADEHMEALVAVPYKTQRAAGTSVQSRWSAECHDLPALLLAIACGDASMSFIQVNQKALDAAAREKKGPSHIPGVKFIETKGLASAAK